MQTYDERSPLSTTGISRLGVEFSSRRTLLPFSFEDECAIGTLVRERASRIGALNFQLSVLLVQYQRHRSTLFTFMFSCCFVANGRFCFITVYSMYKSLGIIVLFLFLLCYVTQTRIPYIFYQFLTLGFLHCLPDFQDNLDRTTLTE